MKMENKELNTTEQFSVDSSISAENFEWIGQDEKSMQAINRPSISYWKDSFGRLKRDKAALVFIAILVVITICAAVIPMISPYTISEQHIEHINKGMFFKAEDGHMHIFGTDTLGRDVFVRIWHGARTSLIIAFSAVIVNCLFGILYGGISGYCGGKVDNFMMRFVEILNGIPYLLIVILLMMVLPRGTMTMIIAYATVGWIGMARLVRGQVISLKEQEFIIAARTMGASASRILTKHLIPNILSIIIVNLTLSIPSAIFTEAFLSFIGLGVPIPGASWGTLANDGVLVFRTYPTQLILPAFFISITMLSFNLLGDKLRDAFDPRLRR